MMNCPHCGAKVKDPDLSNYCPACGRALPVTTREERNGMRYRGLSLALGISSLFCFIMGLSLLLPEVIIAYIGGLDGDTLYWPIQAYLLVAGAILLVVRYPFARRSRRATVQLIRAAESRWVCTYCGKANVAGATECESCGAPIK